jgi:hypothetical protein
MTQTMEQAQPGTTPETDLVSAVQAVLAGSDEPLTLSKIRAQLPARLRGVGLEELGEALRRQVAANVLTQYPKYRSQQDRFWDRPMPVHVAALVRACLQEGPLASSELRRKLPAYAVGQAEAALQDELAQGRLHRHPPAGKRGGERFGLQPPDPKEYLRTELTGVFRRLMPLGFSQPQLREGALELLHEEEWSLEEVETGSRSTTGGRETTPRADVEGDTGSAQPGDGTASSHMTGQPGDESFRPGSNQP